MAYNWEQTLGAAAQVVRKGYNPEQPRAPKGTSTGGQWTATGAESDKAEVRAWFGDSKVVDADGEPLVVYRGVKDAEIVGFQDGEVVWQPKNEFREVGGIEPGIFFSPDKGVAQMYGTPIPYYLKAINPVRKEDPLVEWPEGADAIYRMRGKGDKIHESWEISVRSRSQIRPVYRLRRGKTTT